MPGSPGGGCFRVEAVRPLEFIDQRNMVVRICSRFPCSDSDVSDDDVLLVGAVRPLMSAAPLGGTDMLDDCWLQATSLDHVVSDGAWVSENRHETCCARLDGLIGWFHLILRTL